MPTVHDFSSFVCIFNGSHSFISQGIKNTLRVFHLNNKNNFMLDKKIKSHYTYNNFEGVPFGPGFRHSLFSLTQTLSIIYL